MSAHTASPQDQKRVMLLGATGTIGQATARALVQRGHEVVCFLRPRPEGKMPDEILASLQGTALRFGDVTNIASITQDGFCGEPFDAVVSCMASRTGTAKDAKRIDYQAHKHVLAAAQDAGASHMVLLSAICVQKPKLAFQKAKLAFEDELIKSGLTYSIVRPTAFFKSLSGQIARVRAGKPYLMFGDGALTACKPISDDDLAAYIAECLTDTQLQNRILPIGGPGPAITPKEQGDILFTLLDMPPRFRKAPPAMLIGIARLLSVVAKVYPPLAAKAEYARIGHYYATESMLVLNDATGEYDASLTPSTGHETLADHYKALIANQHG